MPYDPRSVPEGGNRKIDIEFSRKAPKGKFRVVSVDTFDASDLHERDCDSQQEAIDFANDRAEGQRMFKIYVYDDKGTCVHEAGEY